MNKIALASFIFAATPLAIGCGPMWKYQGNYGVYSVWDSGDIGVASGEKVAIPGPVLEYVISNPPSPILFYYDQAVEMSKAPPDEGAWRFVGGDLAHLKAKADTMGGNAAAYARAMAQETTAPINLAITGEGYAKIFWGWKADKEDDGTWDMHTINASYLVYLFHNASEKKVTLVLWDINSEAGRIEYDISGVGDGATYEDVAAKIKQVNNTFGKS